MFVTKRVDLEGHWFGFFKLHSISLSYCAEIHVELLLLSGFVFSFLVECLCLC